MSWTNYHSHSYYCDGKNHPEDYILEAVNQGLAAYGYSSHAPVPFSCEWSVPERKIESYISDINIIKEKYRDKLEVYLGLEVDYVPGITGPRHKNIQKLNLDYTIGSIHFIDKLTDGEHWCFDYTPDYFMKGIKEIFNGDAKKMVQRFFELSKAMLQESTPDIIGHFDKIRMHNSNNSLFDENEKWYKNEIDEILKLIKSKNVIIEINTRGYYKSGSSLYPDPALFEKIRKMDIPISLNSDSHKPDEITKGYKHGAGLLKEAGIDEIWALIDKQWKPFHFDIVKGIDL